MCWLSDKSNDLSVFLDCRNFGILVIKNTLLKSGQAKSKISKRNNKNTNVSQNDSVRLANEGALMNAKHSLFLFWAIVLSWHSSGFVCHFHEYWQALKGL